MLPAETGSLTLHGGAARRDDLAADVVPALGLVTSVQHFPPHVIWRWDTAFDDLEIEGLVREERSPLAEHHPQQSRPPAVLRDLAVDRHRVPDVDGERVLD